MSSPRPESRTGTPPPRPSADMSSPRAVAEPPAVPGPSRSSRSNSGTRRQASRSPTRSRSPSSPERAAPDSSSTRAPTPTPTSSSNQYYPPWLLRPHAVNPDPMYHNAPVLSEYLDANFVPSVVPQPDEYAAKEHARQYLEKLADQISPGCKLLPFGSMANGFALKNSDMDLCCFLGKDAPVRSPSELVEQLGTLIERETNFYVKMLPRARIPIIKLNMPATPTIPEGMACDIGFENRLALENTRLLYNYANVDQRLRTIVLFLKVWTKRRKINNPYRGTLSSYGYVLLVIHFLCHVKQPPVLPNLQRLPLSSEIPLEDLTYEGHDISFFDDLEHLSTVFTGQNVESVGELLIDFFKYFANSFDYTKSVISIRSEKGTLGKEEKGWHSDVDFDPEMIVRDLHKLCIEDPFALDYNVARTVTKDGLYTIRGEFMRAVRILTTPSPRNSQLADRVTAIMNELCAEREDFLLMHPPPDHHLKQQQYQNQQHQSSATLQPSAVMSSKSPRRRSAPSPQLRPAPPQHPSHHPSPVQQYGHAPVQGQVSVQAGWQQTGQSSGPAGKGSNESLGLGLGHENGGGGENLFRTVPTGSRPDPQQQQHYPVQQVSNPRRPQHLQPGSYPRTNPPAIDSAQTYHSPAPSSVASSVAGDVAHDRRLSWDSTSQERPSPEGTGGGADHRANVVPPPSAASNGYDLHRFFQNPSSSSSAMSDVGIGPPQVPHPTRTTVSLTAPPSPDLAPVYFSASHGYSSSSSSSSSANAHYVGRTPYRYPSSNYPSASSSSAARHASVPRNPHAAHYAYSNPYAPPAAPTPPAYPLNFAGESTSTTTAGPPSTPPYAAYHPLTSTTTTTASAMSSQSIPSTTSPPAAAAAAMAPSRPPPPPQLVPAPIFPAEDRDRIARASSITFGNFPELLPLPSYAHYHASGGSAAYLSGSGGWGVQPYGMGGGGGGGGPAGSARAAATVVVGGGQGPSSATVVAGALVMAKEGTTRQRSVVEGEVVGEGRGTREVRRTSLDASCDDGEKDQNDDDDDEVEQLGEEAIGQDDRSVTRDEGSVSDRFDVASLSSSASITTDFDSLDRHDGTTRERVVNGRGGGGGPNGLFPTALEHLSLASAGPPPDRSPRQRGRSVPHTRMGPDGRECILFGAIEVTLPKPEDVEAAEREEEERETTAREAGEHIAEVRNEVEAQGAREDEIANSGVQASNVDSIPLRAADAVETIPTFTTSPPTPAKATDPTPAPIYAWRPLSPLFSSTPVAPPSPPSHDDTDHGEHFDLDRTPRPASPSALPPLSNGSAPVSPPSRNKDSSYSSSASSSSASDSPRAVARGLSMLSMGEEDAPPSTPPRSKHAAKRARQNERRKVAATQTPSSPPPLALTSNSLV